MSERRASFSVLEVPQIVVLDFDRMLASDEVSMERLYAVSVELNLDNKLIDDARVATENDGGSFEPLTIVEQLLGSQERFETFLERYRAISGYELLFPDAQPFLGRLDEAGVPHRVLTYGVSTLWQQLKIQGSGYSGPYDVMEHSDKGERIASWRNAAGKYEIVCENERTLYVADSVCLLDDKAKAFKSLPKDCTGFWVKRTEVLLPSQRGEVPRDRVEEVYSLGELVVRDRRLVRFQPEP